MALGIKIARTIPNHVTVPWIRLQVTEMRFTPDFLDEIRARLPVSQVVARKVALKKKGREFAGLSPFKVERTPSFFVNDQKGFYHCFASGEHGDIFTFLMKTEGLDFPEAVERLAQEAGVQMPKPSVREEGREDERQRLFALLEAATKFFEANLAAGGRSAARDYLATRGLEPETLREFRLGYAANSRSALRDHLAKAGYSVEEMITAGMLIAGDDIPVAYDRFRHRVMFPIADMKGRTIAFGGRALDPGQPAQGGAGHMAKYLNSPETPLFHKGCVLFNAHRARLAAHDKGRIIAVEGYMDVLALWEAGFREAAAPLGTALTADQVKLLWRMAPEPVLCFDGDGAGREAAFRAIDTVLPLLKPGASVMFAFLPDGLDPDDLIRQQGPSAMERILARCRPLIDVLFEREWTKSDWSTPERRARLEQELRGLVARIEDQAVRSHYGPALAKRLEAAWQPAVGRFPVAQGAGAALRGGRRRSPIPGRAPGSGWAAQGTGGARANPSLSLRKSLIVAGEGLAAPHREALILRAILSHPWLADEHAETIAGLVFTAPALSRLRDAILSAHALDKSLDTRALRSHLSKTGLDKVVNLVDRAVTHRCDKFAEPDAGRTEVEDGWRHTLALHERHVGVRRSLEAAERAWHEDRSEDAYVRICELHRQLERSTGSETFTSSADDDPRS